MKKTIQASAFKINQFFTKIFLLLILVCITSISNLFSQQFINPVPGSAMLTTAQLSLKTKFQNLPTTQSLQFVQLGNPLTLQQQGILTLQVPGITAIQRFKAKYVRTETNGDFTWIGDRVTQYEADNVTIDSTAYATITLMKKAGRLLGEMQIDDLSYQIKDLGQGLHALILLKAPVEGAAFCGTTGGTNAPSEKVENEFPETLCPVKVLVLYTQAALDAHPDILDIIDMSVAETNQAFLNSNISEATLKLVLAGTHLLTPSQFTEVNDPNQRFELLTNPFIANYRAFYHADLVYVMTDDIYDVFTGAVAGFGDTYADKDSAFAIVEAGFATAPVFTFAHETGHLFGARHQINEMNLLGNGGCGSGGDNSGPAFAHGFSFSVGHNALFWEKKFFFTLMGICSGTRLQSYSNPNVFFNGKATGLEEKAFNAKVLAFASCRVSHYFEDEAPALVPSVAISNALDRICTGQPISMKAVVVNVPGTISYSWATSLDGTNYNFPTVSTSNVFTTTFPLSPDATLFVKVIINNGNGIILTAVKAFVPLSPVQCANLRPIINTGIFLGGTSVYPNPASTSLFVRLTEIGADHINLQIIDIFGKIVQTTPLKVDPIFEEYEIDISTLNDGLYWIKFDGSDFHSITRFVCQR